MEETNYNQLTETGLSSELISEIHLISASTTQRFLNYLIDSLLLQFGLSFLAAIPVGVIIGIWFPDYSPNENMFELLLLFYLVGIVNYLIYYTICEKAFKGYTLGKLITGTRAVREDGNELTIKDALLRSLSRIVPFEAFSAFGGYPWHDSWTKTRVIKSR